MNTTTGYDRLRLPGSFPTTFPPIARTVRSVPRASTGKARTRPETFTKSSAEICGRRRYMLHMADDRAAIAHLLRRATFGPAPGQVEALNPGGVAAALDQVLTATPP